MIWNVKVHHGAAKQLDAIPPDRRTRILNDIDELAEDPFRGLVKPLKAALTKASIEKYRAGIALFSSLSIARTRLKFYQCCCAMNGPIGNK